jgi:DNA-directed RNA polymerase specialized sigma24 family protein
MAYAEIGEAVGCGAKAAESRVRTALAALRRRFAAQGDAEREWLEILESSGR